MPNPITWAEHQSTGVDRRASRDRCCWMDCGWEAGSPPLASSIVYARLPILANWFRFWNLAPSAFFRPSLAFAANCRFCQRDVTRNDTRRDGLRRRLSRSSGGRTHRVSAAISRRSVDHFFAV